MDTILVEFKDGDGGLLSWTEATIADWCRQSVNSSKKNMSSGRIASVPLIRSCLQDVYVVVKERMP
jgi:hypothetical protein